MTNATSGQSWLEFGIGVAVLGALSALLISEGRVRAELEARRPLPPKELYSRIAGSQVKLQIIDVRTDADAYGDTHIPGAIPVPGCDPGQTPGGAGELVFPYVPTVVVSEAGAAGDFAACAGRFASAVNLAGGMQGWMDAGLPEDSGDYVRPRAASGGGCL